MPCWHGTDLPLIIFGLYHAAIVVAHRWLGERRRASGVKPMTDGFIGAAKMFAVFSYVSLSIPLFHLQTADIIPFYASLLPLQWWR